MSKLLSGDDGKEVSQLKHLVIFLNYCQSRLDNPVYRLFATESLYRRNATLLFLPKPLDERELLHEVSELRKKQKTQEDITFHICSNLVRNGEGDSIVNTLTLIRRLFPADIDFHYPTFVYGQMPNLLETDEEIRKEVWRNLVVVNNAVSDHIECRLLTNVYLYNDNTQDSLARFIFNISHSDISFEKLSSRLPIKQGELFGETSDSLDFPPIFGGFNTFGISYPELETRTHLQQYFIYSALRYSLSEVNETQIEACNAEAQRILSFVPIQTERICLQEEMFINVNPDENTTWQRTDAFWEENVELQIHGLSDIPRDEWLLKIRQRVDSLYQGRFREIGCDYFFKLENKKTVEYCNILKTIIEQDFSRAVQSHPYSPEGQKTIVRGIVNILQQKVMEIQNLKADTLSSISQIEVELNDIKSKWNGLNIFNRLMGKDSQTLDLYRKAITRLMIQKSLVPGCDFAVKLLNELIPAVSALLERCDDMQRVFTEALRSTETMVRDTNPTELFGIFGNKELMQSRIAIESDSENLIAEYQNIVKEFFDSNAVVDGDDLLSRIRTDIIDRINTYIDSRIDECSIPPVLNMSIVERISRFTGALGGFAGFVDSMKRKTPITIGIKKSCAVASKYILVAPKIDEKIDGVEHITNEDNSQLQLLNIKYGLTLQDLDGFSGQRMFVEPSIF